MPTYSMQATTSSDIESASYNSDAQILTIFFRRNQASYSWAGVPLEVWYAFVEAPSQGKFFAAKIKGRYSFNTVRKQPWEM